MMQASIKKQQINELQASIPTIKETTSQQLFNHLFEACNIFVDQ